MNRKSCYLLYGPDRGKQQAEIHKIRNQLEKQLGEAPEQLSFVADQDSVENIVASLRNGSLFYSHLLVTVQRADAFSAADAKQIQAYWEKPNTSSTVLFLSEEYKDVKDRFKFVPKEDHQVFWEVGENEKSSWIRNYFRQNKGTIDDEALELFCELVESDTLAMKRDCDTLLLTRPDGHIGIAEVEAYIFHSRQENVFTLFECVIRKDFEASLAALQKIILSQESEPIGIVNGLQWQFRNFHALKTLAGKGPARRDQFEKLNVRNFKTQAAFNAALPLWDLKSVERGLHALALYDSQLRQARQGVHVFLLECMVYQVLESPQFSRVLEAERFGLFEVSGL